MTITKNEYADVGMNTKTKLFKKYHKNNLLNTIDKEFASDIQSFWMENYNKKIDTTLHMAYMNLTGKKEVRLIPGNILTKEIFPIFNDYNVTPYYGDKNIYETMIKPPFSPDTVVRKIGGNFFDSKYNPIDLEQAHNLILYSNQDLIIKLSKSNNGHGVAKLGVKDNNIYFNEKNITFNDLLEIHNEDFIIQKLIQQHPNMAAPHPASVNTIRMVTFRWKGEIRYLFAFARFGAGNDIRDNANVDISPRLGISDSGEFSKIGISQNGERFTHHPTTGYCFEDLEPIPNYDEFKDFVKEQHKNFLHLDIISWDIAVGVDGKPIFIENNFAGSTSFYQMVTQRSFFGELTEEVLKYVTDEWKARDPLLMYRHRSKIKQDNEKKQQKRLKSEKNKKRKLENKYKNEKKQRIYLEKELKNQAKKYNLINQKYEDILNSKSFKYTKPLRKISNFLK